MNKGIRAAAAALVLALAGGLASANTVYTSYFGDVDGFGSLVTADAIFDPFFDVGASISDAPGTDEFIDTVSVTHITPFSGTILSATLQLFHGGWGGKDPARLLFNGTDIGALSIGEIGLDNFARLDSFDLYSLLDLANNPGLLTGNDTVTVVSVPISNVESDDGVLDYSLLTITTDAAGSNPVPEPATWALTALALAGLAASRRRRR